MNSQLDIAGSFILAGMMLLSFNMLMVDKQRAELVCTNQVIRQVSVSEATSLMMFDLRKAGFRCTSNKVLACSASSISFRGDIDNNGVVDTVSYSLVQNTKNGTARTLLRRQAAGTAGNSDLDIQRLNFTYFDKDGNATLVPGDVKTITVTIAFRERVQTPGQQGTLRIADFRITPKNL